MRVDLSSVIVPCRSCGSFTELGMDDLFRATELHCPDCGKPFNPNLMLRIKNADRSHRIAKVFQLDDVI